MKYNEIELNRKVDLASYNDYETQAKSIDWQVRADSENQEFDLTTIKILKTYADRFILKASEYGISRYEKILNIKPEGSLEDRRRIVYSLWNKQIIWTHRTLGDWLDMYAGVGEYQINLDYDKYQIIFNIRMFENIDVNYVIKTLRYEILPANLLIRINIFFDDEELILETTDIKAEFLYHHTNILTGGIEI